MRSPDAPDSEPTVHTAASWAPVSGSRAMSWVTTAVPRAATATPPSRKRWPTIPVRRPAEAARTIASATADPSSAAGTTPTPRSPHSAIPATAPAEAPWEIPRMSGLARGLPRTRRNSAPDAPNARPASAPRTARGSLSSITTNVAPGIVAPPRMATKSGMVTV